MHITKLKENHKGRQGDGKDLRNQVRWSWTSCNCVQTSCRLAINERFWSDRCAVCAGGISATGIGVAVFIASGFESRCATFNDVCSRNQIFASTAALLGKQRNVRVWVEFICKCFSFPILFDLVYTARFETTTAWFVGVCLGCTTWALAVHNTKLCTVASEHCLKLIEDPEQLAIMDRVLDWVMQ